MFIKRKGKKFDGEIKAEHLIEKNLNYYLDIFKKMDDNDFKNKWNLSAFLLGPFWCIYKRMNMYGFMLISILVLAGFFPKYQIPISLMLFLFVGYFGNSMYKRHINILITEGKSVSQDKKCFFVEDKKGESIENMVIWMVAFVVLQYAIYFL